MEISSANTLMVMESDINDAIKNAEQAGLPVTEIAAELRRKAEELDAR